MHSDFQDWCLQLFYSLTNAWSMEEESMTKTRRCHLCLASGGTIFALTPLQACGLHYLGQKQQLGPSLYCVHRKLHKGLRMESIWGCVSLGCGDRWGAAGSSALSCQTAGRDSCLFPQGVSNKRGTFPSLEIKQTQIDDVTAFLRKRGKQFSDVFVALLSCAYGWGCYGQERSIFMGKQE